MNTNVQPAPAPVPEPPTVPAVGWKESIDAWARLRRAEAMTQFYRREIAWKGNE